MIDTFAELTMPDECVVEEDSLPSPKTITLSFAVLYASHEGNLGGFVCPGGGTFGFPFHAKLTQYCLEASAH